MGIGTADVFLDGAVMDAIRNPLCICNRGFITEVMQQNATWNYGPMALMDKSPKEQCHTVLN